jgi:hypothetical protein
MKKIGLIAVAAMLTLSPALAQSNTVTTNNTDVDDFSMPAGSDSDFNTFMTGFGNADFTASFDDIDKATSVNIVKLSGMANLDAEAAEGAFTSREADLDALRGRLQTNAVVTAALSSAGVDIGQVVAASTTDEGSVTLYINDLS